MIRTIAVTLALLSLSGCNLAVILVEGGEVQSIGSGTCMITPTEPQTGTVCIHDIADSSYSETFTAVPNSGWEFVKWNTGSGFNCADSINPVCEVTMVPFAEFPGVDAAIAADNTIYIMPIFTFVGYDPGESSMGSPLAINFTPGLLVDQLLVEVLDAWLTDPEISLDIEITGINGTFEFHGDDVINVVDTNVFSTDGHIAQTVVDWTTDTISQNVNEVYTVCVQPIRNTTELIGAEKCAQFGPY